METTAPPPASPQQWLLTGTCIGHYRVEELISSGGFGAVYRVTRDGRNFALKLPPSDDTTTDEERRTLEQRVVREVVSLMTLGHPNIVKVHGFDRWPSAATGALYLVMDFVEGVPLRQWRRVETPTIREVVQVFQALALALDEMHRLGVVHRDIKSSNFLVSLATAPCSATSSEGTSFVRVAHSTGSATRTSDSTELARPGVASCSPGSARWLPVVVDFGLARPAFTTDVTREYVLVGTEGLWAPEHAACGETAFADGSRFKFTPATDLHSLGLLFYQALTGHRAFPGDSRDIAAVATAVALPPSTVSASIPEALDATLLRLLAKKPEERTPSGAALAEELTVLLATADERWDRAVPSDATQPPPDGQGATSPQRPALVPQLPGRIAALSPPPFREKESDVAPVPVLVEATASITASVPAPAPIPPRRRRWPLVRWLAISSACCLAVALGAVLGLWLGGYRRLVPAESPGAGTSEARAPAYSSPPSPTPAELAKRAAVVARSTPAMASSPTPAPRSGPGRDGAATETATTRRQSAPTVVRAVVTCPVRVGEVEAQLLEPLVARGLIVLPVGTTVTGVADQLPDGGFALKFDAARPRGGVATRVDGSARLDARAGRRQPLRPGGTPPEQFEFEFSLSTTR